MKRSRLTIGGMLAFVVLCAIAFAALKSRTLLWAQILFTIAVTVPLIATIGASVRSPRGAWIGAAIFGWGYGVLVFAPWFSENVEPWLLTTGIMDRVFEKWIGNLNLAQDHPAPILESRHERLWMWGEEYDFFVRIGHSLSMILHSAAGAILGYLLQNRDAPSAKTTP